MSMDFKVKLGQSTGLRTDYKADSVVVSPSSNSLEASPATSFSTSVKKDDVLEMMSNKSVCAGWDVVFSMTTKQINAQLKVQYSDRQGNPKFLRETGKQSSEGVTSTGHKYRDTFEFKFNVPKLQFLQNNSNTADVYLPIISGHWVRSFYINDEWIIVNEFDLKESDGASILGNVDLAIVTGSVSSQHNVAIKLKGGHFQPKYFEVDVSNPVVATALTDYFAMLGDGYEVYNFGTLDFKQISVLKSLQPSNFLFKVYHTPSNRDLLQLFIATTGELQSSTQLFLREPVPSAYDCSLIVSSKIFCEDVMPEILGNTASGLVVNEVAPDSDFKTSSSEATAGSVSCPLSETRKSTPVTLTMNTKLPLEVTGSGQNQMVGFEKSNSVSLFALKNLLFPDKNLFDMKEAFVPCDMVVFGNFTSANMQN